MKEIFFLLIAISFILPNCSSQHSFLKQDTKTESRCFPESFKRNQYFTGKLLTEQDLNDEQAYQNEKRKLHNRFIHGYGVVCGLIVSPFEKDQTDIVISAGIALDNQGREILVGEKQYVDISKYKGSLYISLKYLEYPTYAIPVPGNPAGKENDMQPAGKIQEMYQFEILSTLPPDYQSTYDMLEQSTKQNFIEPLYNHHDTCCNDNDPIILAKIEKSGKRIRTEDIDNIKYRKFVLTMEDIMAFLFGKNKIN